MYVHVARLIALSLASWLLMADSSAAQDARLKYIGRYDRQDWSPPSDPDHLTGVETIWGHYALICSNPALTLVDLDALPSEGTRGYLSRLVGLDCYTTVTRDDGYSYVNLRLGGLAVVYVNPTTLTLTLQTIISEPGVFFEKMAVVGDRLYVAAHAYGIRIYDITIPDAPALVGSLTSGFDDAFAIQVLGNTAYVADGAGGLKIVDLTDETAPVITAGEDAASASGTAEDVMIIGSKVYVASGGAGVAVYPLGTTSGTYYDTAVCAKHLALAGDYLAVADIGGLQVFTLQPDGSLIPTAGEYALRRRLWGGITVRVWYCVSAWGTNRVVVADWDSVDVFELVDPSLDNQADITASRQRLRFPPGGGSIQVGISNDGSGPLDITDISITETTFSVLPTSATLQPGETLNLTINYLGGQPGDALVLIDSNDPDENPLPIEVHGDTIHLDPGEPAIPFNLPAYTFDHVSRQFTEVAFDLQSYSGKIIFFHVFGTW